MKVKYFSKALTGIIISFTIILLSCEKENNDINVDSLIDTKWKLTKVIDSTGKISNFPSEIDDFEIIFLKNGIINLPGYCNYSFGDYQLGDNDSLTVNNVGPGTEMFCGPDLAMEWENLFINSLICAETYSINGNELTINCKDNKLVFSFLSKFNSNKGKILFCTNSYIINCPFSIEISVENKIMDTLSAGSEYDSSNCACPDTFRTGLSFEMTPGNYNYSAKEINCSATNKTDNWNGEFTIKPDSCKTVFLDINE
jgi:heat shock protein HslJ